MKIEESIQQKSFNDEYHKAHINLLYTVSWMNAQMAPVWKRFGITMQQYNILRILRGVHPCPASVKELTSKMIDRSSNASRLVDKLLEKDLAERAVCPKDRRKVEVVISDKGLKLVEEISIVLDAVTNSIYQKIGKKSATILSDILDELRS